MSDKPLVSAEEMASVLSDTGGEQVSQSERVDVDVPVVAVGDRYSLRRPLVIAPEDEPAARRTLNRIATELAKALAAVLDAEVHIEVHGFQQQQVRAAIDRLSATAWVQAFGCSGEGGGIVLGLDPSSALAVVELALGGAGTYAAEGRTPTALENRIMKVLTQRLSVQLAERLDLTFSTCGFRTGSVPREVATPGEMVGAALLKILISGAERNGILLVSPHLLKVHVEEEPTHPAGELGPLVVPLLRVPFEARPVLRAGRVTLNDICDLRTGSVLTLDAPSDRELELRIGGVAMFSGRMSTGDNEDPRGFRILRGSTLEPRKEEVSQ